MICERVVAEEFDPKRLENLFLAGVDEISYSKNHNYLTLVTNPDTGKIVYGSKGKSASPTFVLSPKVPQVAAITVR